ncbi:MAG TPA: TonB-dependent siderophore receptor [Dongiaceae bacterium]|nr:TonB-dependent siderophore receptor [Dongiaceae bacterium]
MQRKSGNHPFNLRPLTIGSFCLMSSLIIIPFAHGETPAPATPASQNATQNANQSYDIPAGPLTEVLTRFSAKSGIFLMGSTDLAKGKNSAGLKGQYSAQSGLQAILVGTGLAARFTGEKSVTIEKAPEGAAILPQVLVQDSGLGPNTEGTESYTTGPMTTATQLPLSIRETPQSVTVMTRERMDDLGAKTATDLLRNTPGITSTATAPYRETFMARGFEVDNYLIDGLPLVASQTRSANLLTDLAMFDRVEIVRGSTGLTLGSGSPSAAVNFVRKRPTREFQSYIQGEIGRWDHYATEADVSGSLTESGGLRARAVARWQDSDSFQDIATEDRKLAYLIGELDLGRNTVLSLSFTHQDNDNNTTYGGLPTAADGRDLGLPRSTYFGNTWTYWDDTSSSVYGSLEHRFDNDWKLNFSITQMWGEEDMLRAGVLLNDNGGWDQNGGRADYDHDRLSYGLFAQGPFRLFNREHALVMGANYRLAKENQATAGYWPLYTYATNIDIYNWHHNPPKPQFENDYHSGFDEEEYGAYTTARLNLADPLKLIVGLRVDWFDYDSQSRWNEWDDTNGVRLGWTSWEEQYGYDKQLTPYGGLIYDINSQHSTYVSYTEIFDPQNERTASNEYIEPIVGETYEFGIKGEYFDGLLNVALSVYRLDQGNKAIPAGTCPFDPSQTCYKPAGLVRSEGYDLEIQGALTHNWQIGGGYTHVETTIEKDEDPANEGSDVNTDLPTDQFKLTTTYRFGEGTWRVGGNLRWQNDVYFEELYDSMPDAFRTEQDAYTIVDLMLGYKPVAQLDLQLNVTNAFDKTHYSSIQAQPPQWGGNAVYGEPRNVMLTARYEF